MRKRNMRRISIVVTAQTASNLERLANAAGYREIGRVVDKLTREQNGIYSRFQPTRQEGGEGFVGHVKIEERRTSKPHFLYDFECCGSIEEFKQTIQLINDNGYNLISVVSIEGAPIVIFQRPVYG